MRGDGVAAVVIRRPLIASSFVRVCDNGVRVVLWQAPTTLGALSVMWDISPMCLAWHSARRVLPVAMRTVAVKSTANLVGLGK